jgi:hypothetical protein
MKGITETNVEYLGETRKSPGQVLKVSVGDFAGRPYIYCTVWQRDEQDDGPGEPTHIGLTLRPSTLKELMPLFQTALEVAKARRPEKRGKS